VVVSPSKAVALSAPLLITIALTAMTLPRAAFAQPAAPPPEPPPRLESGAQVTFLNSTGNTTARALGLGGDVTWRPMPWVTKAKVAYAETEDDDVLSGRSLVVSGRADRFVTTRTSFYAQYDFLRDLFSGVEQRHTVAGGLAYRLVDRAPHRLTVDGGLGYQHEARIDEDSVNSPIATTGLAYKWEISKTSDITEEFRYSQALDTGEDWKLDQLLAITASITNAFSLKLSNIVRYSNNPPISFETTDTITSIALVWTVKRPGP
jgi:putative salt-induced outer membrane protein